jgi:hypothetical protein
VDGRAPGGRNRRPRRDRRAIAFLDGCYGIKPSESEFRVALA